MKEACPAEARRHEGGVHLKRGMENNISIDGISGEAYQKPIWNFDEILKEWPALLQIFSPHDLGRVHF